MVFAHASQILLACRVRARARLQIRSFASGSANRKTSSTSSLGTKPGQAAPCVIAFSTPPAAALAAFKAYQRQHCLHLHAGNLLSGDYRLVPAFLPFWLFEATISGEARATLGRRVDRSGRDKSLVWTKMDNWEQTQHRKKLPASEHCMQVYASYRLRRDLAEAAKPDSLAAAQQLSRQQLEQGWVADGVAGERLHTATQPQAAATGSSASNQQHKSTSSNSSSSNQQASTSSSSSSSSAAFSSAAGVQDSGGGRSSGSSSSMPPPGSAGAHLVQLEEPCMRQAIAWQLCQRAVMHEQIQAAAALLKSNKSADEVRDLQVRLVFHCRTARLAWFPAYHLAYIQGERYSGEDVVPAGYEALVGGGREAGVAAELHPSPVKAQGAVVGACLGLLPLSSWILGATGVSTADVVFLAVLAAAAAGALAARLPLIARNRHAAEQREADLLFYRQYDQQQTAPGVLPDAHTLWLWKDADWRHWERDDPWNWVPDKRQALAERLFRQHAQRGLDTQAAEQQQKQQSEQRAEEEHREEQRQHKFGRSRHFTGAGSSSHHQGWGEAGARQQHHQRQHHQRRRDFLGYYKALGINLEEAGPAAIGLDFIKTHYKAAALRLHPDRHVHADEATQRRQLEKFRRLQLAYETLRDPEKRRAYDQGRM